MKKPRVRGRVKTAVNGKTIWVTLSSEGLNIRTWHCRKSATIPLQSLVDLSKGQLPLL